MFAEFQTAWIQERLRELGKPKNGLAKVIGQSEARVTGIIKGTRQIKARELPAVSHYLELPVCELLRRCCGNPGFEQGALGLNASDAGNSMHGISAQTHKSRAHKSQDADPLDDNLEDESNAMARHQPYLVRSGRS